MSTFHSGTDFKSRPKVLVLGNGILRAFGGMDCKGLESLIYKASKVHVKPINGETISFPLRVAASFAASDDCHHGVEKAVEALVYGQDREHNTANTILCASKAVMSDMFTSLVKIGFDDIITTNYSYEVEKVLLGKCPTAADVKSKNGSSRVKDFYAHYKFPKGGPSKKLKKEQKYKIKKCYRDPKTGTLIWHIHGEYLRPHSIIFGNYEYGKFLGKIQDQCTPGNYHRLFCNESKGRDPILDESWVDAFLFGDVFILGFGAALDESVFWWLMDRKKRMAYARGRVCFYAPIDDRIPNQRQQDVVEMLSAFGAECRSLSMRISKDSDYMGFYEKAVKDIIRTVKS